jgi:hypothetical protein
LSSVEPAQSGIASAIQNAVGRLSALIAVACVGLIAAGPLTDASFARLLQASAVLFFTGAVISGLITTNSAIAAKRAPRELATVGRDRSAAQPALAGCA